MPYGLQFADEPVAVAATENPSATKPNETYRKETDDWDA